jgi:hypothetical protein
VERAAPPNDQVRLAVDATGPLNAELESAVAGHVTFDAHLRLGVASNLVGSANAAEYGAEHRVILHCE